MKKEAESGLQGSGRPIFAEEETQVKTEDLG